MMNNTNLLDYSRFYSLLDISRSGEPLLVNAFLSSFYELFNNFKAALGNKNTQNSKVDTVTAAAVKLRDFIDEAGGLRASEILAEYEKYSAIGDFVSCKRMENYLIEEIELFKEAVVSMFA